jgi:hypothetical protein
MPVLQLPKPVEQLHGSLPHPGLAQILKQQRSCAAVELEQRLEDLRRGWIVERCAVTSSEWSDKGGILVLVTHA